VKTWVRVKRRGKSSPLFWRQERHGKPHPEQDQIGERLRAARLMFSGSVARGSRQLLSQMNDHRRVKGDRNAEQDSAYDLLPCLFIPLLKEVFTMFGEYFSAMQVLIIMRFL